MPDKKKPEKVEERKNRHAVALGKLGGKVGGPARAKALSRAMRQKIAAKGGRARAESLARARARQDKVSKLRRRKG